MHLFQLWRNLHLPFCKSHLLPIVSIQYTLNCKRQTSNCSLATLNTFRIYLFRAQLFLHQLCQSCKLYFCNFHSLQSQSQWARKQLTNILLAKAERKNHSRLAFHQITHFFYCNWIEKRKKGKSLHLPLVCFNWCFYCKYFLYPRPKGSLSTSLFCNLQFLWQRTMKVCTC